MKLALRMLIHSALCCATLLAAVTVVRADEPKCATCPSTETGVPLANSQADVWLARLPMVGHLFKSGPVFTRVRSVDGPCYTDTFERMGIDFDVELCPPPPGFHVFTFSGPACPCDPCHCISCACTEAAAKCGTATCQALTAKAACSETNLGCENCPANQSLQHVDHLISAAHPIRELTRLFEHIAELSADKAAAEAALEIREEAHEQFVEFFESMAELVAENAALEAKLAAQIEHGKLAEKLVELASENARLKAQVELADQRHELLRGSLEVAVENERLKFRVAELEKHHATATAGRVRSEKKPR